MIGGRMMVTMRRILLWLLGLGIVAGVVVGLGYVYRVSREGQARERERDLPVQVPPKDNRTASGEPMVALEAEMRQRAALKLAAVAATTNSPETKGFGKVLDPSPLAALQGEWLAAEAALTNSAMQQQRARTLFQADQNVSRRVLETAEAQYRADEIRLQTLQARFALEWGDGVAKLDAAGRARFLAQLVARQTVLVRVDFLVGETPALTNPVAPARVAVIGREDKFFAARLFSAALTANTSFKGAGFFFQLEDPDTTLRPGTSLVAYVPTGFPARQGVEIPCAALVRWAGQAWVYVQGQPDKFSRRAVPLTQPTSVGWFVQDAVKPGESIVVEGQQTLLSEELKSQIHVGEEAEKQ